MSIENLLNYSVDNTVINHYLHLLAKRDVKAAQIHADLMERLRLSDEALVEACGSFRLAQEAKVKIAEIAVLKKLEAEKNKPVKLKQPEKPAPAKNKNLDKPKLSNPTPSKSEEKHIGQFIVRNDGTLLDTKTGLMWCRYSIGQQWKNGIVVGDAIAMEWQKAKKMPGEFNKNIVCGSFSDWRLPSINEFPIIRSREKAASTFFPHDGKQFWSSSEENQNIMKTTCLFRRNANYVTSHKTDTCYVRLVRNV
ncbi:DUF1566 domain-containing protein [Methylovulum psychrotolerans]|uniref:Lcl C-terminal domain-containing protein n=1 Tax=Methylovulum psychrotolerans TaxID=1704499 RepID=A0A2S5CIW5_9GAMM|nr:DUF1566 domain-containing protein [Methylovulum psychrotolerans]POZ50736.1 hypothetical protein AADEFJLK_03633 [Methylovulum psychrotolerans]